jgi:hypothetical protein
MCGIPWSGKEGKLRKNIFHVNDQNFEPEVKIYYKTNLSAA